MAHGIMFNDKTKQGDIVDFKSIFPLPPGCKNNFKLNYEFIWSVYKDVADQHGIKLPKYFVSCELYTRRHKYIRNRENTVILEPMGPVVNVDYSYGLNGLLNTHNPRGYAVFDANWYVNAEKFFMVHGSAATAMSTVSNHRFRQGLMCERWRALKFRP